MEKKVFIAILSGGNTTNAQHLFQEKEEENIGFRYNNNTFIFSADSKENACEIIKDVIDVSYDGNLLLHGVCLFEATEDLTHDTDMGEPFFTKVRKMANVFF